MNYILAQNPSSDDEVAYNLVLAQLYFRMGDMETSRTYLEKALSQSFTGDNTGYLSVEMADVLDAYDNSTKATSFDDFEVPDYDSAGTPEIDQEGDVVISNDPAASIQTLLWAMTQYTSYGDVTYTETIEGIEGEEENVKTHTVQCIPARNIAGSAHRTAYRKSRYHKLSGNFCERQCVQT